MSALLLLVLALGNPAVSSEAARVLVVANQASEDSVKIARYYMQRRGVPLSNLTIVHTITDEEISKSRFEADILSPVRAAIAKSRRPIDFIVLTRGLPIRFSDWGVQGGYSVDAMLGAGDLRFEPISELNAMNIDRAASPYYQRREPFTHARFGFYLVTRLDGYTADDAIQLVDDSLGAKGAKGPFFFDEAENRKTGDYQEMQQTLSRADSKLRANGFRSSLDESSAFLAPEAPLAGYASWGSNDGAFDLMTYRKLRFLPGALAETFVSTSGRTFRPTAGGQSLVADLIAAGVTGVKGYVSEPFTLALARPDILFDRYTSGFNLAESFYMASPVLKWKDVVIGDPLCRPYPRKRA